MSTITVCLMLCIAPMLTLAQGFDWEYSVRTPVMPPKSFVGIDVATGLTTHSGTLTYSEMVPCCEFSGTRSTPVWLAIGAEYWIHEERAIFGSLGYRSSGGAFTSDRTSLPLADGRSLVTHYEYDVSLSYLGFQGGVRQRLFQSHASVSLGLRLQVLATSTSTLEEVVDEPSDYFFTTNPPSRVKRLQNANAVADINALHAALLLGGGYDISLYRGAYVSPNVLVAIPLTATSSVSSWRTFDVTLGLRFMQAL
jgi:hypothetical protein